MAVLYDGRLDVPCGLESRAARCEDGKMIGGLVIMVVLVVLFPMVVIMSCAGIAAGLGALLKSDVDTRHEGSELLELSR